MAYPSRLHYTLSSLQYNYYFVFRMVPLVICILLLL